MPPLVAAILLKFPAVNSTRYDGILGDAPKLTVASLPFTTRVATGMFDTVAQPAGTVAVSAKVARKAGSSQHGNMRLASVASICVDSKSPDTPPAPPEAKAASD